MPNEGGIKRETLQSAIGALLTVLGSIFGYLLSQADNDRREIKHKQDLHISASGERNKYIDEAIKDLKADNLKQWNVLDANTEKEKAQAVQVGVNANNIKHLQND